MDKKGGERILSVWMFLVWVIVTIGIIMGLYVFYGVEVEVRDLQAEALSNSLFGCIVEQGGIREDFLQDDFDVFDECRVSKEIFGKNIFYFKIEVFDSSGQVLKSVSKGNHDFEMQCELREQAEAKNFARCEEREFVDSGGRKLNILAGSNNMGGGQL